jgi:hypothetical protein
MPFFLNAQLEWVPAVDSLVHDLPDMRAMECTSTAQGSDVGLSMLLPQHP